MGRYGAESTPRLAAASPLRRAGPQREVGSGCRTQQTNCLNNAASFTSWLGSQPWAGAQQPGAACDICLYRSALVGGTQACPGPAIPQRQPKGAPHHHDSGPRLGLQAVRGRSRGSASRAEQLLYQCTHRAWDRVCWLSSGATSRRGQSRHARAPPLSGRDSWLGYLVKQNSCLNIVLSRTGTVRSFAPLRLYKRGKSRHTWASPLSGKGTWWGNQCGNTMQQQPVAGRDWQGLSRPRVARSKESPWPLQRLHEGSTGSATLAMGQGPHRALAEQLLNQCICRAWGCV